MTCCAKCVAWTWRVKLSLSIERDLFTRLREAAETVAIKVFGDNLRDLLLGRPRRASGCDGAWTPGIRTGVKVAVVIPPASCWRTTTAVSQSRAATGRAAVLPWPRWCSGAWRELIAIGNGTASRETDKLAADVIKLVENGASAIW